MTFQHYSKIFVASYQNKEIECDGLIIAFRRIKEAILINNSGIEIKDNYSSASPERAFLDVIYLNNDYHFDNLLILSWEKVYEILPIYGGNKRMAEAIKKYHQSLKKSLIINSMSLEVIKHKNILIRILKDIYTDSTAGPILGFKGGTAAYLFYDLNRFSADLDFDLLDESKADYVFEQIKKILGSYGTVKEAQKKRSNLLFLLSYDRKEIGAQNIKVEINRRNFGSKYEIKAYLGISMKVMVKEDMVANKLCAMYERIGKTNRDIFDVYFFLHNNWLINKQIIESRSGMSYRDFLQKSIGLLEKVSDRNILSGMGELLDKKQKAWAKSKLRTETIFLLRLILEMSYKNKSLKIDWSG